MKEVAQYIKTHEEGKLFATKYDLTLFVNELDTDDDNEIEFDEFLVMIFRMGLM